jgi:hypothetical protein
VSSTVYSISFKNYRTLFSLDTKMFFEEQFYGYFITCHLKYMLTCETTELYGRTDLLSTCCSA